MAAPSRLLLAGFCRCRCHATDEATLAALAARDGFCFTRAASGSFAAAVDNPTDAAAACAVCRDHHVAALSGRPPELDPPARPMPAPPRPLPVAAADGDPDAGGGEGAE